jgi:hypothetical protein
LASLFSIFRVDARHRRKQAVADPAVPLVTVSAAECL